MHVPAAHPRRSTFANQVEVFLFRRGIRLGSLGILPSACAPVSPDRRRKQGTSLPTLCSRVRLAASAGLGTARGGDYAVDRDRRAYPSESGAGPLPCAPRFGRGSAA